MLFTKQDVRPYVRERSISKKKLKYILFTKLAGRLYMNVPQAQFLREVKKNDIHLTNVPIVCHNSKLAIEFN